VTSISYLSPAPKFCFPSSFSSENFSDPARPLMFLNGQSQVGVVIDAIEDLLEDWPG